MKNKGFLNRMFSAGLALATVLGTLGAGLPVQAKELAGGVVDDNPLAAEEVPAFSAQFSVTGLSEMNGEKIAVSGSELTYDVQVRNETQKEFKDLKLDFQVPEGTKLKNPDQTISFNYQDFLGSEYGQDMRSIKFTVPVIVDYGITEVGPASIIFSGTSADGSMVYDNAVLPSAAKQEAMRYKVNFAQNPTPADGGGMVVDGTADAGFSSSEVESGKQVVYHLTVKASDNFSGKAIITIPLPDMEKASLGRLSSEDPEVDGKPWDVSRRPGNVKYYEYVSEDQSIMKKEAGMVYGITEVKAGDEISFDMAVLMGSYEEDTEVVLRPVIEWVHSDDTVAEPTGRYEAAIPVTVKAAEKAPEGPIDCDFEFRLAEGQDDDVAPGETVNMDLSAIFRTEVEGVTDAKDVKFIVTVPEGITIKDFMSNGSKAEKVSGGMQLSFGDVTIGKELKAVLSVEVSDDFEGTAAVISALAKFGKDATRTENLRLTINDGVDRVETEPLVTLAWTDYQGEDPRPVRAGDMVTVQYTIVNNDTESDVQDLVLCVPEAEGFTMDKDSMDRADSFDTALDGSAKVYKYDIGRVLKQGSSKLVLRFKADRMAEGAASASVFSAFVMYANAPSVSDGRIQSENELTAIHETPDENSLSVVMRQDDSMSEIKVGPGQKVAYEIEVYNTGSVAVENVVVTSEVPEGLKYGKANSAQMFHKDGIVTWEIGRIEAGKSVAARFGVTVPTADYADSYTAHASAEADEVNAVDSNSVTMRVGVADLKVSLAQKKDGMDGTTQDSMDVDAGEDFTYVMTVTNSGTAPVAEAQVKLQVPGMLTIGGEPELTKVTGKEVLWYVYDLKEGESRSMEIRVSAPAKLYSNTGSSAGTSNKSVKDTTVNAKAQLAWRDSAGKANRATSNTVKTVIKYSTEGVNTGSNSNDTNKQGTSVTATMKDQNKKQQKVNNTGLDLEVMSKAMTAGGNGHMMVYQDKEVITVKASYTKLEGGKTYTGTVGLTDENGGMLRDVNGKDCSAALSFTADKSGKGEIGSYEFTIDGKDYVGKTIYGAIDVTTDGKKTSFRSDGIEKGSVHSAKIFGVCSTQEEVSMANNADIKGTIQYENVVAGQSYQMVIAVVDRATGKVMTRADGKAISAIQTFKAEKESGSVDIPITFGADDPKGKDLAIYSTLYDRDGKLVLATDHDLNKGNGQTSGKGNVYAYAKTGVDDNGSAAGVVLALLAAIAAAAGAGWYFVRKRGLGRR